MLDLEDAFRKHNQALYRYCRSRLRSHVDAEDAVQEVFARAAKRQRELGDDALPWLLTVARNICLDEQRRLRRTSGSRVGDDSELGRLVDRTVMGNPERAVIGRMRAAGMLEVLTKAEKTVVREQWLHGRTGAGAAVEMGVTRGTTTKLLARARQRLIAYLAKEGTAIGGMVLGGRLWLRERWPSSSEHADRSATATMRLGAVIGAVCVVIVSTGAVTPARTAPGSQPGNVTRGSEEAGYVASAGESPASPTGLAPRPAGPSKPVGATPTGSMSLLTLFDPNHHAAPQQVGVTDAQASPNYSQDHTVLIAGTDTRCAGQCYVLMRSADGGTSWQQLAASGFTSTSLLLPRDGFAAGHFYGYGASGLQVTTDGGKTFQSAGPDLRGYPALLEDATGTHVIVSNAAGIFEYQSGGTASPLYAFPPGNNAQGPAIQVGSPTTVLLQPVVDLTNPLTPAEHVLSCSTLCASVASFAWSGPARWSLSRSFSHDRVIVLWSLAGSALSKDGGTSFEALKIPVGTEPLGLALTDQGPTLRLAALLGPVGSAVANTPEYSDDLGSTWKAAGLSPEVARAQLRMMSTVSPSRLIAPATDATPGGPFLFACSGDGGASWRPC